MKSSASVTNSPNRTPFERRSRLSTSPVANLMKPGLGRCSLGGNVMTCTSTPSRGTVLVVGDVAGQRRHVRPGGRLLRTTKTPTSSTASSRWRTILLPASVIATGTGGTSAAGRTATLIRASCWRDVVPACRSTLRVRARVGWCTPPVARAVHPGRARPRRPRRLERAVALFRARAAGREDKRSLPVRRRDVRCRWRGAADGGCRRPTPPTKSVMRVVGTVRDRSRAESRRTRQARPTHPPPGRPPTRLTRPAPRCWSQLQEYPYDAQ